MRFPENASILPGGPQSAAGLPPPALPRNDGRSQRRCRLAAAGARQERAVKGGGFLMTAMGCNQQKWRFFGWFNGGLMVV